MFKVAMSPFPGYSQEKAKRLKDDTDADPAYVFGVIEDESGVIVWSGGLSLSPGDGYDVFVKYKIGEEGGVRLPFSGSLINQFLTDAEIEIITGMHMPAAIDYLRELVQAAKDVFEEAE